jgi:O-acetyl-ADP-ribose deacetylase (regulator of RNase III)
LIEEILGWLGEPAGGTHESPRRRLQARLTRTTAGAIPAAAWPLLEALWKDERAARPSTDARALPRLAPGGPGARVSLWRGDITTLAIDAIVNAANSGMTGCYEPMHACVDNAIHTAAGPWLREECARVMARRGRPEPTATATVTGGYFLPAAHVLHTVGPIVRGRSPGPQDERSLARCYEACLEAAGATPGVNAIAFCGISTGLFGYPAIAAAPVALGAVRQQIIRGSNLEQIVFVTYSDADEILLARAAQEVFRD